ncbi:MAG: hypothetical protein BBJ57_02450 [Desulfobacterales bacterium PC51MH44]|nr:MAG: hypothetical protein BBJ57_02450 [Desulfobacterales bacterium PC51MH44]
MRIIDGIKTKGQKVVLKGTSRQDLPEFFVDMGFKVGAEIGVDKGAFTELFCQAGLKMYAIDPWKMYRDYDHPKGQKRLDFLYEHTQRTIASYNCHIIRKSSMEAVKDFEDESLDFVYIDGNHAFRYIAEDIFEWSKKIKKGGIMSGHDYVQGESTWVPCHVKYIVNAYVSCYHIKNWYLTDRNPGMIRDKGTQSWFWIVE